MQLQGGKCMKNACVLAAQAVAKLGAVFPKAGGYLLSYGRTKSKKASGWTKRLIKNQLTKPTLAGCSPLTANPAFQKRLRNGSCSLGGVRDYKNVCAVHSANARSAAVEPRQNLHA